MSASVSAGLAATADWRPMAFGKAHPSEIADPLYEPHWPGRRALVEISSAHATIRDAALGDRPAVAALRAALVAASRADLLLVDGYLVPAPFPGVAGSVARPLAGMTISSSQMLRQALLGNALRIRHADRAEEADPRWTLAPDASIAFAAVDVLWIGGESLVSIPLGERKRLLEDVLADGELVQRTLPVRAPAERWFSRWRALGFHEMAVKAANSRYAPGEVNPDWTIAPIPRG